jgi:sterol desaturase/sphingolipid hydroxylase (fatty acid hydroxylase superfamily)
MEAIRALWNFEVTAGKSWLTSSTFIKGVVLIFGAGATLFTVLLTSSFPGFSAELVSLFSLRDLMLQYQSQGLTEAAFRKVLPYVWVVVAAVAVLSRLTIILHSYYLGVRKLGEERFNWLFSTYLLAFFVGGLTILLLSAIGFIYAAANFEGNWMQVLIQNGVANFNAFITNMIPFSLNSNNYLFSLTLSIFLAYLPGYFIHWLCHHSRLLWLLAHRPHHTPEFLTPLAVPNNNLPVLEILMAIPGYIFFITISGMIYHEPLTIELGIWFTLCLSMETFNHSIVHYKMALKNRFIYFWTSFFGGNGVHHLVHHSAYQQDQNVNFGGAPFLFWDRIFGTYRKPYEEEPPLGLTHQPPISMSPMKITFGGFSQLWYELKMNKNWWIRLRIIFGGVYYKPPVTKDFLLMPSN